MKRLFSTQAQPVPCCVAGFRCGKWRTPGFSLIELMIVVAVIAILSAVAYPSYIRYVVKTHRVAAKACLSEFSNYMERAYTTNLSYPAASGSTKPPFTTMDCATASQTGNNYSYNFSGTPTSATYRLKATPINAQLTRDTECGELMLNQAGKRTISGTGTVDECW